MNTLHNLLKIAEAEARRTGVDVNTALKEILHYDILFAISESSMGSQLVFQGGTSLRLCHHSQRYSEDLDFVAGKPNVIEQMEVFKKLLIDTVEKRYGLEMRFKDPKPGRFEDKNVNVVRWTAVVNVPRADKCATQTQKIKIEVADVPSYDNQTMILAQNYQGLAPGYSNIMLRVSTLQEIMADKVVAIAGRKVLKPRDVWDVQWLKARGVTIDNAMVKNKLKDYGETDSFVENMQKRLDEMVTARYAKQFETEMSRFVSGEMRQNFERSGDFTQRLTESVRQTLKEGLGVYCGRQNKAPAVFDMGL